MMKYVLSVIMVGVFSIVIKAQEKVSLSETLKNITQKGDYLIAELRLNNEDAFRTREGSSSSLSRIAIYTGDNKNDEIIAKGFEGINSIVAILNNLKRNGWKLVETYPIKGEYLNIIHYVLERKK